MRPSIRLAALMKIAPIYIFTHNSIGLGEDGPTHQPVEHLAALRAIPNLTVIRPCDANETAEAWRLAVENRGGPTALILSRQNLPVLDRSRFAPAKGIRRGGYVLAPEEGDLQALLIATGSEVHLALAARELLQQQGIGTRAVSLASWEIFEAQPESYRREIIPPNIPARIAVEAASPFGWERYTGDRGAVIALSTFGASAPGETLMRHFGFTPEKIASAAIDILRAPG
jgi:transketolase